MWTAIISMDNRDQFDTLAKPAMSELCVEGGLDRFRARCFCNASQLFLTNDLVESTNERGMACLTSYPL